MTGAEWRSWAVSAGELRASGMEAQAASILTLDSRALERGEIEGDEAVFFAINGVWHDGHDFLNAAHKAGVRRFVVQKDPGFQDSDVLVVPNPIVALQSLASVHRQRTKVPVVAITGSNGKTIVKEWAAALLARKRPHRSPRSFNSQVGVPLSLWGLNAQQELGIIEVGISEPGEMSALRSCVEPEWGVLTHLGEAHASNFPNRSVLIEEKLSLFKNCKWVALPEDCQEGVEGLVGLQVPIKTWGESGDLRVIQRWTQGHQCEVAIEFDGVQAKWTLPAPGELVFRNAMTASLVALLLGASLDEVGATMPHLPEVDLRMQRVSGPGGTWIISDAYANDWGALAFALRDLGRLPTGHERGLILGEFPGAKHDTKRLQQLLEGTGVSKVWLVGKQWRLANPPDDWKVFDAVETALTAISSGQEDPFRGMDVLVKGPRSAAFESFVPLLSKKGHVTSLTLDLDSVTHNINSFRQHIRAAHPAVPCDHPTQLIAVVKASGYGANGPALARALEQLGMSYLAVACTEEGIELRRHGISMPIMVLNPDPSTFDALIAHRLEPELIGPAHFKAFCKVAEHVAPWPVHLKIDTGMHRVGFTLDEMDDLARELNVDRCSVRAETVLSHLAAADEASADEFTQLQFSRFIDASNALRSSTTREQHPLGRHVLNSAGIARFPEFALEYARLGIGMFGGSHGMGKLLLSPAISFETTISQTRRIPGGEGVGYGAMDATQEDRTIAILPVGYGDGYPRHLSNGAGHVLIRGQRAPVVGRVCMDMTLVDITHIPSAEVGDDVVLFGIQPTLEEVAQSAGTIPYELIARISSRVARIHRGG